ncbi:MAG TPA: hypothetical protein VJC06_03885 [Candidatus Paceibacterota bacterium]
MNQSKKSILFVIATLNHYRNYITTGALKSVNGSLVFLVNPALADKDFGVDKDRVIPYAYPGEKGSFYKHVIGLGCWRYQSKDTGLMMYVKGFSPKKKKIYKILTRTPFYQFAKWFFLLRGRDNQLDDIVSRISPSMIMVPAAVYGGLDLELTRIAKKFNIPSFFLIENWDNLGGRMIYPFTPDYLGVWSRQGAEHAMRFRKFPEKNIFILGTPRFINYFHLERQNLSSPYPFKFILYAGSSLPYNELEALHKLDDLVSKYRTDLKVIFRPGLVQHVRNCPDVFFEYDFKNMVLDIPARAFYKKEAGHKIKDGFNPVYSPDMSYFPRLFTNMEFMVCPLSTMMLEGLVFNKRVYGLAHDDGLHWRNLKYLYDTYEHFRGIERVKNSSIIHRLEDLEKIFTSPEELKTLEDQIDIDYFISNDTRNYSLNLGKAVDAILTNRGLI